MKKHQHHMNKLEVAVAEILSASCTCLRMLRSMSLAMPDARFVQCVAPPEPPNDHSIHEGAS
eukprot:9807384-Karenia_brevis.AAC.1